MSYTEDQTVLISAIEHFSYCPRQCGLIYLECVFEENVFTLRGRRVHERADQPITTHDAGKRIERALPLWSERYGLYGKADTVEFLNDGSIHPVEYKHGTRKENLHDDLQLCAQALCLEEMLGKLVGSGAIFHQETRRRREVVFTEELRRGCITAVEGVRSLICSERLPEPVNDSRCPNCSLVDICVPGTLAAARRSRDAVWQFLLSEDREEAGEWLVNF